MVNVPKLRGKIAEREMNICKLAEIMGIDRSTMYRKLSKPDTLITIRDVRDISVALHLSTAEVTEIFFTHDVA